MRLSHLSPTSISLIQLYMGCVLLLLIYDLARAVSLRCSRPRQFVIALLLMSAFVLHQSAISLQESVFPFSDPPLYLLIPAAILLTAAGLAQLITTAQWRRTHLSALSVKEAFDSLPTGMCYFMPYGHPILVNAQMNSVCEALLGEPLTDALELWDTVSSARTENAVQGGDAPIAGLPDGRVMSFSRRSLSVNGIELYELTATDVTKESELTRELAQSHKQAKALNQRLKALLDSIGFITMSREILQLKMELHDNIGRNLLITRRYLLDPDSVDRKQMLSLWDLNMTLIINEEPESWQRPYYLIRQEAELLGIELDINGELPTEPGLQPIADEAVSAHLTNVMRHAGGTRASIDSRRTDNGYVLLLTNDGNAPVGPVSAKGGLLNLRKAVEAAGGRMELRGEPRFELEIFLPSGAEPII